MKNTRLYDHLTKFSLTDLKLIKEENDDFKEDHEIAVMDIAPENKEMMKQGAQLKKHKNGSNSPTCCCRTT